MDVNLGLDISTSVIGWSIVDSNSTIIASPVKMGHIDLRRIKGGFWDKVEFAKKSVAVLAKQELQNFSVKKLAVEDPLKKFARGMSSADTLATLSRFNALVSYFSLNEFSVNPVYIDATSARKIIGIPLLSKKKSNGLSHKEQTFNFLSSNVLSSVQWPKNKNGKLQQYCYDEVDAYVIAMASCMIV